MQANSGYLRLAEKNRAESIDEMKHADELVERVLFLDGVPNLQRLGALRIGESPVEQLRCDLALEIDALKVLKPGISQCRDAADIGSALLLERILHAEEEHIDWLETQLALVESIGAERYLAEQF